MDALLQAAIRRRELEREEAIREAKPALLGKCVAGCGTNVMDRDGEDTCSRCRKRGLRPQQPVPQLAVIPSSVVERPMSEPKVTANFCTRPGCGKKLRRDNRQGVCSQPGRCGSQNPPAPEKVAVTDAAQKDDTQKPMVDLLPTLALLGVSQVLTFGAKKYAPHNWRKGLKYSRLLAASMRHIFAFVGGEDLDPESGLSHIDCATCSLLFLSELQKTGGGTDDRWKETP
jgi:hypothetical protein